MAYPGDGSQDGREAQWAGPPAGQRGPEAKVGLAAKGLAWLQRNLGADSGARLNDLYLLYRKDAHLDLYTHHIQCKTLLQIYYNYQS